MLLNIFVETAILFSGFFDGLIESLKYSIFLEIFCNIIKVFTVISDQFTFMHLADAFIQSDLQCIQAIHVFFFFYHYVCSLGIEPTTFCVANAMLYH